MLSDFSDKISVIVPVYNIEKYLERCIESLLAQIYKNIEVVVVDDGSKDNSLNVAYKAADKDSRVKVVSKVNEGVTKARLTGVSVATGDWIGFVDGDDFVDPEMFETLLSNAKKYDADISHCGYKMVFPSRIDYYYNTGKLVEQDNLKGLEDLLSGAFIEPCMCNKLYKKSVVDKMLKTEKIDYSIKNNEDLLLNFYLFKQSKSSVYLDKCFYHYILRKGSAATSSINENKLKDPLKVLEIIKSDCKDKEELLNIVNARISANLISASTMKLSVNPALVKPHRDKARKELRALRPVILHGNYSIKRKFLVLWVSVWPWSYSATHTLYSKIRGLDKKYEVK